MQNSVKEESHMDMNTKPNPEDGTELPAVPAETEIPAGIDRRSFLIRNAVIGAAAVMTGTTWTPEARAATGRQGSRGAQNGFHPFPQPGRRETVQGPGDDRGRGVLQGGSRPLEFAHDRTDAHHLRLLPALHEAAGRPTRQGDRPQGPPVWQPERHRQGARHRARLAGGPPRQGTGHGGSAVPRRDEGEAGRKRIR